MPLPTMVKSWQKPDSSQAYEAEDEAHTNVSYTYTLNLAG